MFTANLSHPVRPVCRLLGSSGIHPIIEREKPDVAALLKPRIGLDVSRSMPVDAVVPPWEVDYHDLDRDRVSAIVIATETDYPELVLEKM